MTQFKNKDVNIDLSQYKQCCNELLSIIEQWNTLELILLPNIKYNYEKKFGELEEKIFIKKQEYLNIEFKIDYFSNKLKQKEAITYESILLIENIIKRKLKRNFKFDFFTSSDENIFEFKSWNPVFFSPQIASENEKTPEIKKIYREIVKKLHPDKNSETEFSSKYWELIRFYYEKHQIEQLNIISMYLLLSEYIEKENHTLVPSEFELIKVKNIIVEQNQKISKLKQKEPYIFEKKLNDKIWFIERKRFLREIINQLNSKLKTSTLQLKKLIAENNVMFAKK